MGKPGGAACGGLMGIPYGHMFRSAGVPGMRNPVEAGGPSIRGTLDLESQACAPNPHQQNLRRDDSRDGRGYPADIKAAWFAGGNVMGQRGNVNKGVKALKGLEFTVGQDLFMTPTMRYCDIVLPVSSFAEKNDLTRPWPSGPYLTYANKAIEPLGSARRTGRSATFSPSTLGFEGFNEHDEDQWLRIFVDTNPEYKEHIPDYDQFKAEGIHRIDMDDAYIAFQKQIEDPETIRSRRLPGRLNSFRSDWPT